MKYILILCLFFVTIDHTVSAQTTANSDRQQSTLRVFLDCRTYLCDFDFFRTEIEYIDYVRDQNDADVHVLITTQRTGGGGNEFTINFIGHDEFSELSLQLNATSQQTDTDDEIRNRLVRVLKAGLMPFVSQTAQMEQISITHESPDQEQVNTQAEADPWNYWVFRTNVNGHSHTDDRFSSVNLHTSVSASRTTEAWKIFFMGNGSHRSQTFTYDDKTKEKDVQEDYGADAVVIKSISEHWSLGAGISSQRSTRSNYDLYLQPAAAIEYNIFPYSESTRKLFMIRYIIAANHFDYSDLTIFDKMEETLFQQSIEAQIGVKQPWGELHTRLEGNTFLHDLSKLSLVLSGEVDVRIFRGLSFNFGGMVSLIRDQLNIAKGNASNEDVLLRRRELETDWRLTTHFGIRYTFGSIYNNIVNPRFGL